MRDNMKIFTEVFPINLSVVPKLFVYRLIISSGDISTIGGKLSYRLKRDIGGHWVWTCNRLVSDTERSEDEIMHIVRRLWREQPHVYGGLQEVSRDFHWRPTSRATADYVARGLFKDFDRAIRDVLREKRVVLGNAYIERVHEVRGWVVNGEPAVSISVSSHLLDSHDLKWYASKTSTPNELIGLWVLDKTSTAKGEITEVIGNLGKHRERLLALTTRKEMEDMIENAPDEELVIGVKVGPNIYEYIVSALKIIVRTEDFVRLNIDPKRALKALRIEPRKRYMLIKTISEIARSKGLIGNAYISNTSPDIFITADEVGFDSTLRFGEDADHSYDERMLLRYLRQHGVYKRATAFEEGKPIRMGIINAIPNADIGRFLSRIQLELRSIHFENEIVKQITISSMCREKLEVAVNEIIDLNCDIILAFFPDEFSEDEEDGSSLYYSFKTATLNHGMPSQVINQSTLDNPYAVGNIILGVLGKTGNIPYILAKPLPYADLVVGLDIARERKKRLQGSINATAIARIYFSNGEFLRYVIHDTPLEGETIPNNVLQSLFPLNEFKNRRVVVHRDGYFRGNEKEALKDWARRIGATFYLVEIIKTGTPRLYKMVDGNIQQPPKGSAFILSNTEAFLVSSLPPFTTATPRPLHIRTERPFGIKEAIHSVLSLTLLHYGSLRPPRCPVTIHYSDKIAYLALRGVKPKESEGTIPFWL